MAKLVRVTGAPDLSLVRELFAEYARAVAEPCCFEGFERELASLPGEYAPPRGVLARGGRVVSIPFEHERSTSALLKRIHRLE